MDTNPHFDTMNGISWRMAREDSMILTFGVLPLVSGQGLCDIYNVYSRLYGIAHRYSERIHRIVKFQHGEIRLIIRVFRFD